MSKFENADAVVNTCILHQCATRDLSDFMVLSNVKGGASNKLKYLHEIRDKRLQQPLGSPHRMEDVCMQIPESTNEANSGIIGYHRHCYQKFTNHLDRLKFSDAGQPSTSRSPRKRIASSKELFPDKCIFCDKKVKKFKQKHETCVKFAVYKTSTGGIKEPSWKKIEQQALELGLFRLHRKVQGEDLFAKEAKFHRLCRKAFTLQHATLLTKRSRENTSVSMQPSTDQNLRHEMAHAKALDSVVNKVREAVIRNNEVIRLRSLLDIYIIESCVITAFLTMNTEALNYHQNLKNTKFLSKLISLQWQKEDVYLRSWCTILRFL